MMRFFDHSARGKNGGYTLLFAVLTATLVLGVAVFIVDLARKQHELAIAARNSIYSFYAADSAVECAVSESNWAYPGFSSTTPSTLTCGAGTAAFEVVPSESISIIPSTIIAGDVNTPIRQQTAYVSLDFNTGTDIARGCALITVTTGKNPGSGQPMKIIDARGYNACTDTITPDVTNPNTVERALRLIQSGIW